MSSNEAGHIELDQKYDRKKSWLVRKRPVYIVLCFAFGITLPIFIWLFSEMHSAGKALDAFSQKLILKDYDGAYSTASPEFQAAISNQDFALQMRTLCAKLGSLKSVTRGGSETKFDSKGGYTTISTTFAFENAQREFSFKLKKVAGSWRVYGYSEE
jgi:hypothetical protein